MGPEWTVEEPAALEADLEAGLEAALGEWSSFPVVGRVWRCSLTLQGKNKQEKKMPPTILPKSITKRPSTTWKITCGQFYEFVSVFMLRLLRLRSGKREKINNKKDLFGLVKRYISGSIMRNKITLRLRRDLRYNGVEMEASSKFPRTTSLYYYRSANACTHRH